MLRRLGARDDGVPTVVLLPAAGAGASLYRPLQFLPLRILVAIRPAREQRLAERPVADVDVLLDELVTSSISHSGPIVLVGHSAGGYLVPLAASALSGAGCDIADLVVVATAAPHHAHDESEQSDAELIASLRRWGGSPAAVAADSDLLAMFVPALRADLKMASAAAARLLSDSNIPPVRVVGASDDTVVPTESIEAWQELPRICADVRWVSGGHFFLPEEPRSFYDVVMNL